MAIKIVCTELIEQCTGCSLHITRRNVVKGRGKLPCQVLILGDCPTTVDDLMEEAFIGEVGKLLDTMLTDSGLFPNCSIYLTNTILCRATDGKNMPTREPRGDEIIACGKNVLKIINEASPRAVVLLGDLAAKTWRKFFPAARIIQHPLVLLKTGGKHSPSYLKNIRILEEVYDGIKNYSST